MNEIKKSIVNLKSFSLFIFLMIILFSLYFLFNVLYPFILAFIIAYIVSPLTLKINKYFSKVISSFMSLLIFIVIIFLVFSLIAPILFSQFEKLITMAPLYAEKLKNLVSIFFEKYNYNKQIDYEQIVNFTKIFLINFANTGTNLISGGIKFFNGIFNLLMVFVLTFYMLLELDNIKNFFLKITKSSNLHFFSRLLDEINQNLSRYLRGQGLICIILSIYYALSLFLITLEFGLILGIFIGLISFVPYIGAFLGLIIAICLGLIQFGFEFYLLNILLIFIFGQLLESYYLTPKFIGQAIKLNPLWIVFSLSCGGNLFGFVGILIAIPFAAIIGVIVRYWFSSVFDSNVK